MQGDALLFDPAMLVVPWFKESSIDSLLGRAQVVDRTRVAGGQSLSSLVDVGTEDLVAPVSILIHEDGIQVTAEVDPVAVEDLVTVAVHVTPIDNQWRIGDPPERCQGSPASSDTLH